MPADERYNETHALAKKTKKEPSCFDRPSFSSGYFGFDRVYHADGSFDVVQRWIWHHMSKDCQIAKEPLEECGGCSHVD